MTNYLDQKIAEALEASEGDVPAAAERLCREAEKDELLYEGITSPLLKSASALAVQRYVRRQRRAARKAPPQPPKSKGAEGHIDPAKLFQEHARAERPLKPLAASDDHSDTLKSIADAFGDPKKS